MKPLCLLFFLCCIQFIYSQSFIKGKVAVNNGLPNKILVENITNSHHTITDSLGYFSISAIPGDVLKFSNEYVNELKIIAREELFKGIQKIDLVSNTEFLEEIVVNEFGRDFLMLDAAVEKISKEKYMSSQLNILGLITSGIGLMKNNKKAVELPKFKDYEIPKPNKHVPSYLTDKPYAFYESNLDLPKHMIDAFLYYLALHPDVEKWKSLTEEELIEQLKKQLVSFYKYYEKR